MDKKLIKQAVEGIELTDIYLYSSLVERYGEIHNDSHTENMGQQSLLKLKAEFLEPVADKKNTHMIIKAKVSFGVRLVDKSDSKEIKVLSEIRATFIATYLQLNTVSEKAAEEFIRFNVVHNVWPFWREHAFRMSSEAHLPRPKIGLFNELKKPINEKITRKMN